MPIRCPERTATYTLLRLRRWLIQIGSIDQRYLVFLVVGGTSVHIHELLV